MSLIGTAIGALVALVPAHRAEEDKVRKLALKVADLSERFDALTRTRQQLVNHIELIERQLDAERALANHWRGEAQRFARQLRENREQAEAMYGQQQNAALAQQAQTLQQNAMAQYNPQALQQLGAQRAQDFDWQGFCNCVPSRAQVWGAHGGLVQRLNDRRE